tara:strand:- start:920 stop:1021 length:102 start_codon:yes stop_codon:yes gene_type:complete
MMVEVEAHGYVLSVVRKKEIVLLVASMNQEDND